MLRTHHQPSLWETLLPAQALRVPAELEAVDRLLDDPAFIEPFVDHFHPTEGRPSTPIATYLRLMFHKYWLDVATSRWWSCSATQSPSGGSTGSG